MKFKSIEMSKQSKDSTDMTTGHLYKFTASTDIDCVILGTDIKYSLKKGHSYSISEINGVKTIQDFDTAKETIESTDMTIQEFYSGFDLSFLTPAEKETIYTATEWYSRGKAKAAARYREALAELVRLKDLKDELDLVEQENQDQPYVQRYAEYVVKKKWAWREAKKLLSEALSGDVPVGGEDNKRESD